MYGIKNSTILITYISFFGLNAAKLHIIFDMIKYLTFFKQFFYLENSLKYDNRIQGTLEKTIKRNLDYL